MGPVYYRYLAALSGHAPIEPDFTTELVDRVLVGLRPAEAPGPWSARTGLLVVLREEVCRADLRARWLLGCNGEDARGIVVRVVGLIDEWELGAPHVFGPDIGGPAALFAAAESPSSLTSAIIGNGATAYPLALDGAEVTEQSMGMHETYEVSAAALEDYMTSYAGSRFGESARFVRNYPTDLAPLEGLLPQIHTPVKMIDSDHDPMVPLSNAEYLKERLPRCELTVLDAGHFAWEDKADAYGDAALAWLEGGFARVACACSRGGSSASASCAARHPGPAPRDACAPPFGKSHQRRVLEGDDQPLELEVGASPLDHRDPLRGQIEAVVPAGRVKSRSLERVQPWQVGNDGLGESTGRHHDVPCGPLAVSGLEHPVMLDFVPTQLLHFAVEHQSAPEIELVGDPLEVGVQPGCFAKTLCQSGFAANDSEYE